MAALLHAVLTHYHFLKKLGDQDLAISFTFSSLLLVLNHVQPGHMHVSV